MGEKTKQGGHMKKGVKGGLEGGKQRVQVKITETKKAAKPTHCVQNSRETYH